MYISYSFRSHQFSLWTLHGHHVARDTQQVQQTLYELVVAFAVSSSGGRERNGIDRQDTRFSLLIVKMPRSHDKLKQKLSSLQQIYNI